MKHETKLYRGEEAVAYAKRNLGAYIMADPWLEALIGHKLWDLEEDAEALEEIFAEHGAEGFTIRGGVSDAHDEAFFCWLIRECDYLRSRMFSTDFSGRLYADFSDEDYGDIGVDLSLIPLATYADLNSVTLECIGLRLAREGKLRAVAAGDSYEFIVPDAPPLKVWAVLASSKENALKALESYKPAVIEEKDRYGVTFSSPTGRLE